MHHSRKGRGGSSCLTISGETLYLPLWCSTPGCQRTAWSLGPTPLAGLVTRTRVSSHCYGGSMHPKVRRDGWESEREKEEGDKMQQLKNSQQRNKNIQRKMLKKCDELWMYTFGITLKTHPSKQGYKKTMHAEAYTGQVMRCVKANCHFSCNYFEKHSSDKPLS